MNRLLMLVPLGIAALFLILPESSDGRGRRRPGMGGGAGVDAGGGGDKGESDSGSGETERAAPSDGTETGPSSGLADNQGSDAPKEPINAIHDEIKLHAQLAEHQCAVKRARGLLWYTFNEGRCKVSHRDGLCAQSEHPAEDESPEQDPPSKEDPPDSEDE